MILLIIRNGSPDKLSINPNNQWQRCAHFSEVAGIREYLQTNIKQLQIIHRKKTATYKLYLQSDHITIMSSDIEHPSAIENQILPLYAFKQACYFRGFVKGK